MKVSERFKKSADDVDKLMNFDRDFQQVAIDLLEKLHAKLLKNGFESEHKNGGRELQILRDVKSNDSVREKYKTIFNQGIVLLVSHFASALSDLFREGVNAELEASSNAHLMAEEVKLSFADLKERDWNLRESAADMLIAKYDFSFQDMGATVKAFDRYCGVVIPRDENMNNVIIAQACRHVIVHAGGRVSEKAVKQVSKSIPRTLKVELFENSEIEFTAPEVALARGAMSQIISFIEAKLPRPVS
jgi:hypothetical protein